MFFPCASFKYRHSSGNAESKTNCPITDNLPAYTRFMIHPSRFFFIFFITCTAFHASAQTEYHQKIRETAKLIPNQAVEADSICRILLGEITEKYPKNDSLFTKIFFLLGQSQLYQGKLNLALNSYNKSLQANKNNIIPGLISSCLINTAIIYEKQYRFSEASETYQKAMHLAESQNDSTTINEIWINLGILNQRMSANDKAIDIFNHTYQYCQNRGDTNGMAIILLNMANIYYPDNIKEAERHYEQSLRLSKKINYQYNTAIVLSNLGELEIFKNNYSKATEYILENINLCKKQGLNEMLSISYRLLAQCEIEAGNNPASASEYLETARKLAIETGRSDLLEKIKEVELMMQVKMGNYPGFKAVLKELKELSDKSKQENARIINSEFQTIYEVKKLSDQRDQLLDGIEQKNRQLILSLLGLLGAALAIAVITRQYLRIRQAMKTMYRMNVEMANSAPIAIHNIPGSGIEYEDSPETEDDEKIPINNLYNTILLRIEKDKLYLSPTFSLQDLSENMNRSQRYISRAISEAGKTSFSSLINNFRINEARRLLAADHNITMNEITEKTGFGSRMSFHRNFKAATGFTPAEYQNWSKNQPKGEIQ